MTLNARTRTVGDVQTYVKRQFGDESGTQLTDSDIVRWINDAQLEIVTQIQPIKAEAKTDIVADQDKYDLTGLNVYRIESIHYKGRKLENRSFSDAEAHIVRSGSFKDAGEPLFWFMWADLVTLWPVPQEPEIGGMTLYFSAAPSKVAVASDMLSLSDKHYQTICAYVMAEAFEMDEEFQQASERRQYFQARLSDVNEEEYTAQHATYGTVTYVED